MTRFVVDLGDIALSKEAKFAINADIQKAAMAHIAMMHPEKPMAVFFPRDWLGFILRTEFEALDAAHKAIGVNLPQLSGRM